MGLADALTNEMQREVRRVCHLGRLLEQMSEADRTATESAIEQVRATRQVTGTSANAYTQLTAAGIRRALNSEGYATTKDTVEKHVARACSCGAK